MREEGVERLPPGARRRRYDRDMRRRALSLLGATALLGSLAVPQALLAQEQPSAPPGEPQAAPTEEAPAAPPSEPAAEEPATPAPQAPEDEQTVAPGPDQAGEPEAVAAGSVTVTMHDFSFSPGTVSIGVGDSVTWVNNGPDEPHTATGDGFDTGTVEVGESGSATFSEPGTFSYLCSIHPTLMKGTVRVADAGGGAGAGAASTPASPTAPGSEAAAGASDAAGSGNELPASGLDELPLLLAGAALLALGALARRALRGSSA
jgi:plastocyanin